MTFNRPLSRRVFAAGISCAGLALGKEPTRCEVCGGRFRKQYWTYEGRKCCSQACVDRLRPKCSVCGAVIRGQYVGAKENIYCSEACFKTTLPKCELCRGPIEQGFTLGRHQYCKSCVDKCPTCFSCGLPAAYPTRLKDGREICANCMRWSVTQQEAAERHYETARRQLEAWTSLPLESVPRLALVDRAEMRRLSGSLRKTDEPVSIRGLYSRQVTVTKHKLFGLWKESSTDEKETIYIVDHLQDEVFRTAAMHELMHDLIHEHFPRLEDAPLWVHEGICQQAAAEYCSRRGYGDILYGIENCDDPDYGNGYRYINRIARFQGWNALRRWMETVDVAALPQTAP
ncbi:hypothetical protein [Pontiella sulfatireligans]|uniref:LIM zinc-binding domain-containing protein n=1 Tax=Pontiella sulfatireligans TaxID=2750658 RepID=A0A6C2UMJ0_9BACT|nr:hypothetical protein [Pontiella sulfatireligans]VGO21143.1 hypothetical protein SCARR_03214 [Pontiella sulfatireligans]